jgi:hypothetical protein
VEKIVKTLNDEVLAHKDKQLKVFFIFVTPLGKAIEPGLLALEKKTGAHDLALAYLAPQNEAVAHYKINLVPEVKNTVMVYLNHRVTATRVNLMADEKGVADLKSEVSQITK